MQGRQCRAVLEGFLIDIEEAVVEPELTQCAVLKSMLRDGKHGRRQNRGINLRALKRTACNMRHRQTVQGAGQRKHRV